MTMLLLALAAFAQAPDRDWAQTLRTDAQAMHDDIAANHPGPVNALDPDFAKRNDTAFALALKRAAQVTDYPGYFYALNAYAASFDDGHLGFRAADDAPALAARWPGFLAGYDGDRQVVRTRADDAPVPLGAVLESCDGRPADALAAANVGAFEGRWFLASRRALSGGQLFVDRGNPFITAPMRCTFVVDGTPRTVTLAWRPIGADALATRLADTNRQVHDPIGARVFADGTRWFTLSGFDGDPDSADAKALAPLIATMRADRAAIVAAPRIVLDLRGNNGGSSDWSRQIAEILWGKQRVEALDGATGVDWRASADNVKTLTEFGAHLRDAPGTSADMKRWIDETVMGITAAHAKGDALWHQAASESEKTPGTPPAPPRGPVYFVTNGSCASACLDAADLWKELGAIQVGRETSADTLYMDIRRDPLPSGLGRVSIPMKVYRGRTRGSNEPLRPVHPYPGDLRDTVALEAWIARLPEKR
ncbi:MAG TPA: S41 family peptidase [Sphingomonas sp.]|nr:S41 family peptidase [Sphingomonas sp.]